MKKEKLIGVFIGVLIIGVVCVYKYSSYNNTGERYASKKSASEILKLNSLAISASGEKVATIDIPDSCSDTFGEEVTAYKVKGRKYSPKQINKIMKELKTVAIQEEQLEDGIEIYQLKNGGYMEYYQNAGALSYIGETDSDADMKNMKKEINEKKCKKVAEAFISETGIIDKDEIEFVSMDVCETIETGEGIYPLTYEIYYTKKSPKGSEGFYGIGPGIKIEVDKDYKIRTFISVDKELEEITGTYNTISEEQTVDKVCDGDGVQIEGSSEGDRDVSIDNVNLYLYSDPITEEQTYMAPYYIMDGEDDTGAEITITVPAVEDSKIEYVD